MSNLNPAPFGYVDSIDNGHHVALFYDEVEYARLIEFRFIKNGLDRNEPCIYATAEDSGSVILGMLTHGIPLRYFQSRLLRVIQIHNSHGGRKEILKKSEKEISNIMNGLVSPFRMVSRIVPDVSTIDGISAEMELEHAVHEKFEDFGGSLLCPYDLSKIEFTRRREWMESLREYHHAVIYAPRFGEGSVFSKK